MAPGPSPSISFTASFDDSDGTSIKTSNIRRGVIFYLTLMGPRGGVHLMTSDIPGGGLFQT